MDGMWTSARALALLAAISATGCTRSVLIDSVPQGATVFVDGVPEGETPVTIEIWQNQFVRSYDLRLELAGYEVHEERLTRRRTSLIMGSNWPSEVTVRLQRTHRRRR